MNKEFETLRARAALAGITLNAGRDTYGKALYIAGRWAVSRTFYSLAEVAAWLDQVTGGKK